ncbi:MAG: DsbA family protein [Alphaproteobacteria bacterium]|nr:DsbA family protein [Alphaproteobacteria bacterium]MCD8519975.1 DsbA family protein [Alphaproteobacteria bacterium]MCD8526020.1 DsbA family protein [Alphaproteobacteria bacterium]MCD8571105.1 DsbA family protein [Alphaproteobacteria bacterium]
MTIDFKSKNTQLIGAGILGLVVIIFLAVAMGGGSKEDTSSVTEPPTAEQAEETATTAEDDVVVAEATEEIATEEEEVLTPVALSQDELDTALAERSLGDSDAEATIVEYSSLTCSHCGNFHKNTYKELKEKLIDTGKARIVISDFPLNGPALQASMIARCLPSDKYFDFIQLLFETQDQWAYSDTYKKYLKQNAQLAGLSAQQFENCWDSAPLRSGILEMVQKAQQEHQINSTPTFIVNGKTKVEGARGIDAFEKAVDE